MGHQTLKTSRPKITANPVPAIPHVLTCSTLRACRSHHVGCVATCSQYKSTASQAASWPSWQSRLAYHLINRLRQSQCVGFTKACSTYMSTPSQTLFRRHINLASCINQISKNRCISLQVESRSHHGGCVATCSQYTVPTYPSTASQAASWPSWQSRLAYHLINRTRQSRLAYHLISSVGRSPWVQK